MSSEDSQQFCLRWHNYQASLLATLPQLLDGDDLTDVTLSAGSRNVKAHRVVLSACSEYFRELFKELGASHHPVIVLPGVEFTDLCALVTFMYSGEVNIYEPQLPGLLSMAEALHIKGLADFSTSTNISPKSTKTNKRPRISEISEALSRAKAKASPDVESVLSTDWASAGTSQAEDYVIHDLSKRLPQENNNDIKVTPMEVTSDAKQYELTAIKCEPSAPINSIFNVEEMQFPTDLTQTSIAEVPKTKGGGVSKMYTMCFICGKQLSNHYNLRVHMETHQNVQYACQACSHVSRSRDALRKHVAYRHPPSAGVVVSNAGAGVAASTASVIGPTTTLTEATPLPKPAQL